MVRGGSLVGSLFQNLRGHQWFRVVFLLDFSPEL